MAQIAGNLQRIKTANAVMLLHRAFQRVLFNQINCKNTLMWRTNLALFLN